MNRRSFLLGSAAVTALALGASRLASSEARWTHSWLQNGKSFEVAFEVRFAGEPGSEGEQKFKKWAAQLEQRRAARKDQHVSVL